MWAGRPLRRLLQTRAGLTGAWARETRGEAVRICTCVEGFVDGVGASMRETEVRSDSKVFSLNNDGTVMNSSEEDYGSRKDKELTSFGPMKKEMPITQPSRGAEWAIEYESGGRFIVA